MFNPGERDSYEKLEEELRSSLKPEGAFEEICFRRIAHSTWSLNLACLAEAKSFEAHLADESDEELQKKFFRYAKYRRAHESALKRAIADLRIAQENRALASNVNVPAHTHVSPLVSLRTTLEFLKSFQNELGRLPAKVAGKRSEDLTPPLMVASAGAGYSVSAP